MTYVRVLPGVLLSRGIAIPLRARRAGPLGERPLRRKRTRQLRRALSGFVRILGEQRILGWLWSFRVHEHQRVRRRCTMHVDGDAHELLLLAGGQRGGLSGGHDPDDRDGGRSAANGVRSGGLPAAGHVAPLTRGTLDSNASSSAPREREAAHAYARAQTPTLFVSRSAQRAARRASRRGPAPDRSHEPARWARSRSPLTGRPPRVLSSRLRPGWPSRARAC